MSTLILVLITGVGLGALYFLVSSGLSLIYGLMHVLNFAHGIFLTLGAFIGWEVASRMGAQGGSPSSSASSSADSPAPSSPRPPSSCSSARCTSATSNRCW